MGHTTQFIHSIALPKMRNIPWLAFLNNNI